MNYRFSNIDVSAVTFKGLSLSVHRKAAFALTIFILAGVSYFSLTSVLHFKDEQIVEQLALIGIIAILVNTIIGGEFILHTAAKKLFDITPLGVLYRQDRAVLDRAKSELLNLADSVKFEDYLDYGKINPAIRSRGNILVMAHQGRGDLEEWVGKARNLKHLANLVYQIHLAEQVLLTDKHR